MLRIAFLLLVGVRMVAGAEIHSASPPANLAVPVPATHLHNLFHVSTNLFSGSAPENDAGFAELAWLGVKTLISVDGIKPDLASAHKHGLRYVHLPFGYDGISTGRVAELTKAALALPGPFYVHCHHGSHRGPAAAAVMCEATAGWTTNQAVAWLHQAGTGADYPGLYRTVVKFRPSDPAALARVGELPEVARTPSRVEAMVEMDRLFDRLKQARESHWSLAEGPPDASPAHSATLLWEHLRELQRSEDTASQPAGFRVKLTDAEKACGALRTLLLDPASRPSARDAALQSIEESCRNCHRQYRN